jgi:hypothetical protein
MIKLIVFREIYPGISEKADHFMFYQLAKAYDAELQMIRNWDDAIISDGYKLVIVEEDGVQELETFIHPENAVYVVGRTGLDLHDYIPHNCEKECVRIDTPKPFALFGISAAAIILSRR